MTDLPATLRAAASLNAARPDWTKRRMPTIQPPRATTDHRPAGSYPCMCGRCVPRPLWTDAELKTKVAEATTQGYMAGKRDAFARAKDAIERMS